MRKLTTTEQRRNRVRSRMSGTAERPRLSVNISNRGLYAQIIDDTKGTTLVSARSNHKGAIIEQAEALGAEIAKAAKSKKISSVVFDRRGKMYAKRLHSFSEAARNGGLEF